MAINHRVFTDLGWAVCVPAVILMYSYFKTPHHPQRADMIRDVAKKVEGYVGVYPNSRLDYILRHLNYHLDETDSTMVGMPEMANDIRDLKKKVSPENPIQQTSLDSIAVALHELADDNQRDGKDFKTAAALFGVAGLLGYVGNRKKYHENL